MKTQVELVECEVWLMVDENGDYKIALEADDTELQADPGLATRVVKVVVKVPVPRAVEVAVTVPDLPDDAAVTVG